MKTKRLFSLLLVIALVLSLTPIPALAAADFAGGSGTAGDPYIITTKEHLNNVRNYLSSHFKMNANISFTSADFSSGGAFYNSGAGWKPISNSTYYPFTGTFNGNGYTISGLKINITSGSGTSLGLFGNTKSAAIKNLGMVNTNIYVEASGYYTRIGSIVGYAMSGSTITNCYNTGSITAKPTSSGYTFGCGGIVGEIGSDVTVTNCYNTGKITTVGKGTMDVGGIIGSTGDDSIIKGCYNTGSITSEGSGSSYYVPRAGGIAGYLHDSNTITNCYNTASISASDDDSSAYAGGIVGNSYSGNTISNCYNAASIMATAGDGDACAGGIAGYSYYGPGITSCHNTASITATASSGKAYGGGIVGEVDSGTGTNKSCYNTGTVNVTAYGNAYAGGISGYGRHTDSACYNKGNVTAVSSASYAYAGGIRGDSYYGGNINNSYNTGRVSATATAAACYVGGIAGYAENSDITYCYNIGSISLTSNSSSMCVGGVVGYSYYANDITGCYYLNTIGQGVGKGSGSTTSCTDAQMKTQSTFSGFDFSSTWTMSGNADYLYPELRAVAMEYKKTLQSISVYSTPTKLTYLEAKDTLDVTGGKIKLSYDNGTTEIISMTTAMISGFDNTKVGKQTLTVTYSGKRTTFAVQIAAKSVTSIALTKMPSKLTYLEAKDTLNVTGGQITLTYDNGTTQVISMTTAMVSGFDNTQVGIQLLTVTYGGMSTTYEVEIIAKTLESISVTKMPTKRIYLEAKDILDVTGGQIALTYNNQTVEVIDIALDMVLGFDNTVVGKQTLTVSYQNKTAACEIEGHL